MTEERFGFLKIVGVIGEMLDTYILKVKSPTLDGRMHYCILCLVN